MRSNAIESYKKQLKLSENQREILAGILLGDATMETANQGRTYRLKIEQSRRHAPYVMYLYDVFREWVNSPPRSRAVQRNGRMSENVAFATLSVAAFRFYAMQFYRDGRKCVPELIHRWLTPKALAYWFMDDGSIKSRESKGVIFNTQGFLKTEVEQLIRALQQCFQLEALVRKQPEGWQIYISGRSYERMTELIYPYLLESMRYKFPPSRKTRLPKE